MNRQEMLDRIAEIGTREDLAELRADLAELSGQLAAVFDENENLTQQNQSYAADNETLRNANMRLFLQVGEQRKPDDPTPEPPKPQRMSFDALFDDKGNII